MDLARITRYALYPFLLAATGAYVAWELAAAGGAPGRYYGAYLAAIVGLLAVLERLAPLRDDWSMTRRTFFRRDLPYLLAGMATIAAAGAAASWAVARLGIPKGGVFEGLPMLPAVVLILALPDFFWYWLHRASHAARGPLGRWLWNVHLPHHMPRQLYVVMHVVAHPLNTIAVRAILATPLYLLGFSAQAVFVSSVIAGLQGVISHSNVEMRAGWLNYLLVGNELHRYHHSAEVGEAKNFGNVVPLWDLAFGTFVYRPGAVPSRLGLADPGLYPDEERVLRVLALPFRKAS